MSETSFLVTYPAGHSYKEPWVKTAFFCLACGKASVWRCNDGGDYYQGENYLCTGCGSDWNLPGEPRVDASSINEQRLKHLRAFDT